MSTTILLCLLVCIIGGALYLVLGAATWREKIATLGLWSFVTGLLTTLLIVGGRVLKL